MGLTERIIETKRSLMNLQYEAKYTECEEVIKFIDRAFLNLCKEHRDFENENSYLPMYGYENQRLNAMAEYYLEGRASKDELKNDFFPIIDVLSGGYNIVIREKIKKEFLTCYEN
ncbi:hypothetical protein [Clostridium massiliodielmoense]|uniref:hypothetical protein n=1 Tax=Clostridium massiliodielmoense TaxID=1776385 RepID=UPI000166B351|nr:hypothetical protein [Clostridium massiliodielmoense]EDS76659.1 hypothetical protein CBC_A0225 [Clostridium botulinum C str. Eklund]NEZ49676.1 hypothetical protein [Clostridium botulinum]